MAAAHRSGVISIGECMVELARGPDGRYGLSYGGDTFNTAIYMARAGLDIAYATLLGDDPYSDGIVALAEREGINTDLIGRAAGRNAGLYLIETSASGERTFHYWRDRAPARELLDSAHGKTVIAALSRAKLIYFSGITLSLYSATALDTLQHSIVEARRAGATIAMDGNYRPRGWGGDQNRARSVFERFWRITDIALPSAEDEALLWGAGGADDAIGRLGSWGVREILLKRGSESAISISQDQRREIPVPAAVTPVDTTAAGDSFNAAYLAARLRGGTPMDAALAGHRLAGIVVQHRGAVVPREATAAVLAS